MVVPSYLCDKKIDCVDGADEGEAANCTVTTTTTTLQPFVPKGEFCIILGSSHPLPYAIFDICVH